MRTVWACGKSLMRIRETNKTNKLYTGVKLRKEIPGGNAKCRELDEINEEEFVQRVGPVEELLRMGGGSQILCW